MPRQLTPSSFPGVCRERSYKDYILRLGRPFAAKRCRRNFVRQVSNLGCPPPRKSRMCLSQRSINGLGSYGLPEFRYGSEAVPGAVDLSGGGLKQMQRRVREDQQQNVVESP